MKKFMIMICVSLLATGTAFAQTESNTIDATDIRLVRTDRNVTVSFTLGSGKKAVKAGYDLVVTPTIRAYSGERRLSPIVIRGKRSKAVALRQELAAGGDRAGQSVTYTTPGVSTYYTATIPYEDWMAGGRLALDGVSVGCCSSTEVVLGVVASNILNPGPQQIETTVVGTPVVVPQSKSTGELMAERYPFVAPASEFELIGRILEQSPATLGGARSEIPQSAIAEIREGSISIFFAQGLHDIDNNLGDNNQNLVAMVAAVRAIASASDSRIAAVVIAGFASPEGSAGFNDRLAWNRAVAVKKFLTDNTEVDPRVVNIYNGGVDWTGLRQLIDESDMYQKQRMIGIIDNTPVWDANRGAGRLGELMRLDGGEPYRRISGEFFPQLRQAAFIKVYYEQK